MPGTPVRVLLVDDDEDDYIITRDLIARIGDRRYRLDWINNYDDAFAAVRRGEYEICLLDYRLGERTGLELLRESQAFNSRPPMILLTGQGDHEIDIEAMKAGAADYLVKGQLTAGMLERAMRYAIEGKRTQEHLRRERDLISRIMETSPVGIVVADQSGRITFANHCAEKVLGLTKSAIDSRTACVLGWHLTDSEGDALADQPLPLKQVLESGQPVQDICHAIDFPNHHRMLFSTNATPSFDAARQSAARAP